ncbi:clarin-3 isoform X1 [Phascolarctos cinereus]|uniref:Clarin-3 isoform X1 n=1 Tax=Phascolarctos cinereus TaxID=38626 RepID=A0A6P5JI45_PHACI|nr:clarin-3 isoform X1 [Phascolarctos cinereus]
MPTTQKIRMFLAGFVTSLGALATVCVVLATPQWVTGKIEFSDNRFSNGSVLITYGLFHGESTQELSSGLGQPDLTFEVLSILSNSSQKTLHLLVIVLLFFVLLATLLSSGLTFFNSVSNPYQTWLGPTSISFWNGLSMTLVLVAMILFAVNTQANNLSGALSSTLYPMEGYTYGGTTHTYQYSFWLPLLILFLNIITITIIVFYQKARYHRKQEHRKPMENAHKDGILF